MSGTVTIFEVSRAAEPLVLGIEPDKQARDLMKQLADHQHIEVLVGDHMAHLFVRPFGSGHEDVILELIGPQDEDMVMNSVRYWICDDPSRSDASRKVLSPALLKVEADRLAESELPGTPWVVSIRKRGSRRNVDFGTVGLSALMAVLLMREDARQKTGKPMIDGYKAAG